MWSLNLNDSGSDLFFSPEAVGAVCLTFVALGRGLRIDRCSGLCGLIFNAFRKNLRRGEGIQGGNDIKNLFGFTRE